MELRNHDYNFVQSLCKKYNCSCDIIGKYIKITNNRNSEVWYIDNIVYNNRPLYLYHANERGGGAGKHRQGVKNPWNGEFPNLSAIFTYIKNHSSKIERVHPRVFRMKQLLEQLNLYNKKAHNN